MNASKEIDEVRNRLGTLNRAILVVFFVVALALVYWGVIRGPAILTRVDNPRLVEEELRVHRGRILDANNIVLAESVGEPDSLRRNYPIPGVGPAVGFYSIRHGTAGIEDSYDATLRGSTDDFWADFWKYDTLHESQIGQDLRLTLDAQWQETAEALLGDRNGAVLLFTLPDTAIRVMVSHPDFDPNRLEEEFDLLLADEDAPLLNRVTQSQYQPGLVLQPFLLAAALNAGLIKMEDIVARADRAVEVNGTKIRCAEVAQIPISWIEALRWRCPGAMDSLSNVLGESGLQKAFADFGFLSAPELPVATEAATESPIVDPLAAAIGQEQLTVSLLQIGLALAALTNDGQFSQAQLVLAVQDQDGQWQPEPVSEATEVISASAAGQILSALAEDSGFIEHSALVLSGPSGNTNAWYIALAPASAPRFGAVVVVEEAENDTEAQQVGRSLLKLVLDPDSDS